MAAARELRVHHADEPGYLGRISAILGGAGVNIDGFGVWGGETRLFVSDVDRALELLSAAGISCDVADVLRLHLPDEPGNLAEVAQALGDAGINIDYAYTLTSTVPGEAAFVLAVLDPHAAGDLLDEDED
jgi:hypothetical protein